MSVLILADLSAFWILREALRLFRNVELVGADLHHLIGRVFSVGYLGGWQFAVALVIGLVTTGNYGAGDRRRHPPSLLLACALATALPLWDTLWRAPFLITGVQYVVTVSSVWLTLVTLRLSIDAFVHRFLPHTAPAARTLLVGPGADCVGMLGRRALGRDNGFNIVGILDVGPGRRDADSAAALDELLHTKHIDTILLCGHVEDAVFSRVVKTAMAAECQVLAVARTFELGGVQPAMMWRRGVPLMVLRAPLLRGQQLMLKRALDIVGSSLALLILSPLLLAIALAVRLDSPGPSIFGQRRLGRHGRPFRCYKFRSMYVDAESRLDADPRLREEYVRNNYKLPADRDPRITRLGRFLRRTSLDELPQLWNVLKGDMSLVGPRPIVEDELHHYSVDGPLLLSLKPGITGRWQVDGRSSVAYPQRASLELEYVLSWSLWHDLGILLRTLPAVLSQRGAY